MKSHSMKQIEMKREKNHIYKCIYVGSLINNKVNFYSQSYDYTSNNDYKTKEIDQTIYLNRINNVKFEVDGKKYNRISD